MIQVCLGADPCDVITTDKEIEGRELADNLEDEEIGKDLSRSMVLFFWMLYLPKREQMRMNGLRRSSWKK